MTCSIALRCCCYVLMPLPRFSVITWRRWCTVLGWSRLESSTASHAPPSKCLRFSSDGFAARLCQYKHPRSTDSTSGKPESTVVVRFLVYPEAWRFPVCAVACRHKRRRQHPEKRLPGSRIMLQNLPQEKGNLLLKPRLRRQASEKTLIIFTVHSSTLRGVQC